MTKFGRLVQDARSGGISSSARESQLKRNQILDWLESSGIEVDGIEDIYPVEIDGHVIMAEDTRGLYFRVLVICSQCNKITWSDPDTSVLVLAKYIAEGKACAEHYGSECLNSNKKIPLGADGYPLPPRGW